MDEQTTLQKQDERQFQLLLDFFKALASAERLKVVGVLAVEPLNAAQIAARLGWPLSAAVKHLDYLVQYGLIKMISASEDTPPDAQLYRLDADWLHQASRRVLSGSRPRLSKDDFEGDDFERKVLSESITPAGTLKAIPQQYKKRLVILRYLLRVFEPGQRYPEKQVNELLRRFHPDTAALRRYMVDEGLLARKDGIYWLIDN